MGSKSWSGRRIIQTSSCLARGSGAGKGVYQCQAVCQFIRFLLQEVAERWGRGRSHSVHENLMYERNLAMITVQSLEKNMKAPHSLQEAKSQPRDW